MSDQDFISHCPKCHAPLQDALDAKQLVSVDSPNVKQTMGRAA